MGGEIISRPGRYIKNVFLVCSNHFAYQNIDKTDMALLRLTGGLSFSILIMSRYLNLPMTSNGSSLHMEKLGQFILGCRNQGPPPLAPLGSIKYLINYIYSRKKEKHIDGRGLSTVSSQYLQLPPPW